MWRERFISFLVEKLGQPKELSSYRTFCSRYPAEVLEEALMKVLDTPETQIRKSRGALFVFLVKKLAQDN